MSQAILVLFVLGAAMGTMGDYFHVATLTDGYLNPFFPLPTGQPLWVPFLFASATVAIGITHPIADRLFKVSREGSPATTPLACVKSGLAFQVLYAVSGYLTLEAGGVKDILLYLGAGAVWYVFDRKWSGVVFAICTAIAGSLVEYLLTQGGAFFYYPQSANLFGIPSWLPALYLTASVAVGNLGRYLLKQKMIPHPNL